MKWHTEIRKISELKEWENNPRTISDKAYQRLKEAIEKRGFHDIIKIDENNVVLSGNQRLKILKELGYKEVECKVPDGKLTQKQKEQVALESNIQDGEWDMDRLAEEFSDVMEEIGFGDLLPDIVEEVKEDDYEEPEELGTNVKLGDIYQLGEHRLMCGDSTKIEDVEKLTNGEKADMVFTDPPYGINAVSKSGVLSEKYKTDIMNDDDNTVAINSFNLCKNYFKDAKQVWWGANYYTECLPSAECWIVWDKNNGGSDQTDCELAWTNFRSVVRQFTMASEKINRVHPTQKPLNLISQIFKKFDKNNEYNNIVDLFGGSGSTLIACEQTNRKCYMMEIDPYYCQVIIDRWEKFTGKEAIKLED